MSIVYIQAMSRARAFRRVSLGIADPALAGYGIQRVAWIGIHGDDDEPLVPDFPDNLRLQFNDVAPSRFGAYTEEELRWAPNEAHARAIHDHVMRLDARPERIALLVHCHAGVSRSGAVSMWANEVTGAMESYAWKSQNAQVQPNPLLLQLLHRTLDT